LLLSVASAQDLAPIPPLQTRVTDTVGLLQPTQRAALETKLQQHEEKTGNQVAILLVSDTGPEEIEQYGIRVADTWKIGRQDIDDGVILIIAKNTRQIRLEVGRGAEGVIPDVYAKRIIQDVMAPHFRQGDFYGGLNAATTVIHTLLNKEPFPPPKATAPKARKASWGQVLVSFFFLLVIGLLFVIRLAARASTVGNVGGRHHYYGGYYGGGGFGGGGFGGGGFGGGGGGFGGGGASGGW
jgi:uncharacterized protein